MKHFKIRCSSIGKIMAKGGLKTKGVQEYLQKWYISQKFGIDLTSARTKEMVKGNEVEEDSITLFYSTQKKWLNSLPIKNEKQYENDFLTGTPDIILQPKQIIHSAASFAYYDFVQDNEGIVVDIKSSYSLETFPFLEQEIPNSDYEWQLQGYMDLLDLDYALLAYCLVDTPEHLRFSEAVSLAYKLGVSGDVTEKYNNEMTIEEYINKIHTFNWLPKEQRIKMFLIKRDPAKINLIKERVEQCNHFLSKIP